MDERLQRLARELRAERCPPRVLENVHAEMARRQPRHPFRFAAPGLAIGMAALLAAFVVWRLPSHDAQRAPQWAAASHADQVRVAEEAGAALGYIGSVLLEAGRHAQNVLLNEAASPSRSGTQPGGPTIQNPM